MSAKTVIQKLQDSDLIRLFLEFVQIFNLQYQKTSKQISYKCYQATWILINFKANGYGRTQSQAYKHSLRNLLEILIQQPAYTQFFVQSLTSNNYNTRPSIKKQPLNQCNSNYAKKIISSKTQGHQPVEIQNKPKPESNTSKIYQSYSKSNQRSQTKFNNKPIQPNYQGKSSNMNIGNNLDSSFNTQNEQNSKKNRIVLTSQQQNKGYSNDYSNSNNYSYKDNSGEISQELKNALKKLSQLEEYLHSVNMENQSLKKQLTQLNQIQMKQQQQKNIETYHQNNQYYYQDKENIKNIDVLNELDISTSMKINKPNIPKLKLDILPNYHKKSEKSLNQSLLAAYNQKRDPSVKKLIC